MAKKQQELKPMEKEFIQNHLDMTSEQLSKETGLTVAQIEDFVATLPKKKRTAGKLMDRRSGATVMTEASSQLSDEHRSKLSHAQMVAKQSDRIHVIDKSRSPR